MRHAAPAPDCRSGGSRPPWPSSLARRPTHSRRSLIPNPALIFVTAMSIQAFSRGVAMRIDHIRARNYRTLTDVSIGFKSNYCTLSGHNNAGKSCLVRLILNLLHDSDNAPWSFDDFTFSYAEDKTQWVADKSPIEVFYTLRLNNADDAWCI
jgi:hypothetical protein